MADKEYIVPVELLMESTASLDEEVKAELDIPDPPLNEASAKLTEAVKKGDFKFFPSLNKPVEVESAEDKENEDS